MKGDPTVDDLVAVLRDREMARAPAMFPVDRGAAANPGLYSWWADNEAVAVLSAELGADLPHLLYVGQAGATRYPSGMKSSATLASRVGSQHIRGNARSSTFRLTISTSLYRPLGLEKADGGRLASESNREVSRWIADHLRVAIAPYPDHDALAAVEEVVVRRLDPPLNLEHCGPSPIRARLTELRRTLSRRAPAVGGS